VRQPSSDSTGRVPTVLLIIDHGALKTVLGDWLAEHLPACRCEHVSNDSDGRTRFSTQPPDVVLIDAGLSLKAGLNALESLRRWAPRASAIVLTDSDPGSLRDALMKQGASGCVSKRALHQLVPVIEQALKETAPS
jgi:DNA-binding NarL/FixJ family response regulator